METGSERKEKKMGIKTFTPNTHPSKQKQRFTYETLESCSTLKGIQFTHHTLNVKKL
jgi:hypothetical protein